jgi:cob(I)alamin adenosyltransferase
VGADISVPEGGTRERLRVLPEQTTWLETACDEANADLPPLKSFVLPGGTLAHVMARYGAPIEDGAKLTDVDALDLGGGARLRYVRHLARFDVIAKDWLVYEADGAEPLCALANTVAGALAHLTRAAASTPDTGS